MEGLGSQGWGMEEGMDGRKRKKADRQREIEIDRGRDGGRGR